VQQIVRAENKYITEAAPLSTANPNDYVVLTI